MTSMSGLLTVNEAAAHLGLAASTVRAMCARGKLPAQRIGRDWLINRADLDTLQRKPAGNPNWVKRATDGQCSRCGCAADIVTISTKDVDYNTPTAGIVHIRMEGVTVCPKCGSTSRFPVTYHPDAALEAMREE